MTVLVLGLGAAAAEDIGGTIDATRAIVEKWVQTRQLISKERQDWALGKELLGERIQLVEREIQSLRGKVDQTQESIGEADTKRAALLDENEALKNASSSLVQAVSTLEARVNAMLPRLPDSLRERLRPLSQRIPVDTNSTQISLGERFQNVVGILNEVNRANSEITITSERHTLTDGTNAEVTVMYLGISRGFFVNATATMAGIGQASDSGWMWTPANDAAPQIADAIAILKNEKVATFVNLPVTLP